MFWILLKKIGGKEDKVWFWRNVFYAKTSIYSPHLKNKKNPTKYPNFVEVRIVVIGIFKKNKASHAAKAVQAQLTWKMLLQWHINNHNYTWYHDKSQYFGFLLVLVFMFIYNEAAFLNPCFLFSLKD